MVIPITVFAGYVYTVTRTTSQHTATKTHVDHGWAIVQSVFIAVFFFLAKAAGDAEDSRSLMSGYAG